jgi:hypothetical protein
MHRSSPERWTNQLMRAVLALVGAAVGLSFASSLLRPLLPVLAIGGGVVVVVRVLMALGRRRREW